MGGRSSSSSDTTTKNTSGSVAAQGDNNGLMLSGISESTIDLTLTDYGAVEEAFDFGQHALTSNEVITRGSLEFADSAMERTLGFGEEAMTQNTATSQHAVSVISAMAGQQNATTQAAITMANDAKTREQTGATESNNELMQVLIVAMVIMAVAFFYFGRK